MTWIDAPDGVLAFRRGAGFACVINYTDAAGGAAGRSGGLEAGAGQRRIRARQHRRCFGGLARAVSVQPPDLTPTVVAGAVNSAPTGTPAYCLRIASISFLPRAVSRDFPASTAVTGSAFSPGSFTAAGSDSAPAIRSGASSFAALHREIRVRAGR